MVYFLSTKHTPASQHTQLMAAVVLQRAPVAPGLHSSTHPPTYPSIQFYAPQFFRTSHRSFDPSLQASLVSAALRASLYHIARLFFSTPPSSLSISVGVNTLVHSSRGRQLSTPSLTQLLFNVAPDYLRFLGLVRCVL